jgi:TonB family protein
MQLSRSIEVHTYWVTDHVNTMHFIRPVTLTALLLGMMASHAQESLPESKPACEKAEQAAGCKCKRPAYPADAARRGEQGRTIVKVTIGPDGLATDAELLQSSGSRTLDRAAIAYFKEACFTPPTDPAGKPTSISTKAEYIWRLQ